MDITFKKQTVEGAQIATEMEAAARITNLDFASVNSQNVNNNNSNTGSARQSARQSGR